MPDHRVTYNIIEASSARKLLGLVNEAINEGWEPQGGVMVASIDYMRFYQAMIKIE